MLYVELYITRVSLIRGQGPDFFKTKMITHPLAVWIKKNRDERVWGEEFNS